MKQYHLKNMSLIFAGIDCLNGLAADGDIMTIEQPEDDFDIEQGVDGEAARYSKGKPRVNVKLMLMQTSAVNDKLSAINALDKLAVNGGGVGPLLIEDGNGTSLLAGEAFLSKLPDQKYGAAPSAVEWMFVVPNPVRFVGGNS